MGIHVKLARMTDSFLRELTPCRNGRGMTVKRLNTNVVFRFPNGEFAVGDPVVVDICFEKAEQHHPQQTFVVYLRKPQRPKISPPRYDLELQFEGDLPEKNLPPEKWTANRVRFHHTLNPYFKNNGKPFPILILRENEFHIPQNDN